MVYIWPAKSLCKGKNTLSCQVRFSSPVRFLKTFFGIDITVPAFHIFNTNQAIPLSNLRREVTIKDDAGGSHIRGDVMGAAQIEGVSMPINFEVKVTHEVDDEKRQKLKALDLTTIEIDISHLLGVAWTENMVKEALLSPSNMNIVHICSKLNARFREQASELQSTFIKEITKERVAHFKRFQSRLIQQPLTLPEYRVRNYNDKAWAAFYEQYKYKIRRSFRVLSQFNVLQVRHLNANHLLIELDNERHLHAFIDVTDVPIPSDIETYLLINPRVFTEGIIVAQTMRWGRNRKMERRKAHLELQSKALFKERRGAG